MLTALFGWQVPLQSWLPPGQSPPHDVACGTHAARQNLHAAGTGCAAAHPVARRRAPGRDQTGAAALRAMRDVGVRDALAATEMRARLAAARVHSGGTAGTEGATGTGRTSGAEGPPVGLARAAVHGARARINPAIRRVQGRTRRKTSHQQRRCEPDQPTRSKRSPRSRHRPLHAVRDDSVRQNGPAQKQRMVGLEVPESMNKRLERSDSRADNGFLPLKIAVRCQLSTVVVQPRASRPGAEPPSSSFVSPASAPEGPGYSPFRKNGASAVRQRMH